MAPYVDPLKRFRQALLEKRKVNWNDQFIEIDGRNSIHRSRKCGFQVSRDEYVDIGSIYYMYKTVSSGERPYTEELARKHGFTYIGITHRADLLAFLDGKHTTCRGLVLDVIEGKKRVREDTDPLLPRTKRPRPSDVASASDVKSVTGQTTTSGGSLAAEDQAAQLTYTELLARTRPLKDPNVLVRAPGRPVPNVELILKIAADELGHWHKAEEHRAYSSQQRTTKVPFLTELEKMASRNPKDRPIILVPCNKRSPVNILNALRLLQDGEYHNTDEDRAAFFESTRDEYVEIVRNIGGKLWTFEVRDTTKNFTKSHWLRVVAVVTDGTDWQLKGWPFESVVDVFTTIKGIYFAAVGAPVPQHVTEWAVSILHMAPLQYQHKFAALRDSFWVEVEHFLLSARQRRFANHTTLQIAERPVVKIKPIL